MKNPSGQRTQALANLAETFATLAVKRLTARGAKNPLWTRRDFFPFVKYIIRHHRGYTAAAEFCYNLTIMRSGMIGYRKKDMTRRIFEPLAFGILMENNFVQPQRIQDA